MPFTLINARPSPFGRKVAIALIEKGLDFEVTYDVPWGPDTCTPRFSPLQQLPILITGQGEAIYDSVFILEWLEGRHPTPALLPQDVDGRLEAKKRQMLAERLMEAAQTLIFETHRPDPSAAWIERQTRKLVGGFTELERLHVHHFRPPSDAIDLGDIALGTTLTLFEFAVGSGISPDIDALKWRGRHRALTRVVDELETRPSFIATVPQPMDVDLQATVR